jgi:hypothetical protein
VLPGSDAPYDKGERDENARCSQQPKLASLGTATTLLST